MRPLMQDAALVVTALGLVCAVLVLARGRNLGQALGVLLDFLLAAGLLRLAASAGYRSLATAAVIIVIRKLAVSGLRRGRRARAGARPHTPPAVTAPGAGSRRAADDGG